MLCLRHSETGGLPRRGSGIRTTAKPRWTSRLRAERPKLLKRFEQAGADRVTIRLETAAEAESLAGVERIAEAVLG